jgi:hypothetical protein
MAAILVRHGKGLEEGGKESARTIGPILLLEVFFSAGISKRVSDLH